MSSEYRFQNPSYY
uniref:Uncharacterized protein n=1 Tax=Lepeophtheirus salmonis TaxID=72036 RepID=A0A0K2V2U6_LEPSM